MNTWCDPGCADDVLRAGVTVVNQGAVRMPAGLKIRVLDAGVLVGSAEVSRSLPAGTRYGPIWVELPDTAAGRPLTVELLLPDGVGGMYECDTTNNSVEVVASTCG